MKRITSPRKLIVRAETVAILRQLPTHDLRGARIAGASAEECKGSPPTVYSEQFETWCSC